MRAIGIVLAGGNSSRMGILVNKRAVAAMPIAGSYRSIDFALSNMSNSHVQKVAVCTQFNARSLNQHLNSSKWWDFGRKQGGLFVLTPTMTTENNSWYRGTADAMYQNIDFLRESHEPYVIITSGDCVYKTDFNKMLEYHINQKADITVGYTKLAAGQDDPTRFGVMQMDTDGRVLGFEEKPVVTDNMTVSTGIYIIRRRLLIGLLEKANAEQRYDFVKDILVRYRETKKIYGYEMPGYWNNIATVDSYYRTNMDFLKKGVSSGQKVQQMQEQLNRISDNYPAIPKIAADGIYGNQTAEAVRTFQKIFNLPQTGVTDYATWYKISQIYVGVSRIAELN